MQQKNVTELSNAFTKQVKRGKENSEDSKQKYWEENTEKQVFQVWTQ